MDIVSIICLVLGLLSGIALFLYGMDVMGMGLKSIAGNKLESLLYKLTNTPIKGILLGAGVTAIIQSSSATSVMVVGFVNSGIMEVAQGIGIIMGANIGTSITGWILCLSDIKGAGNLAVLLSSASISAVVAIIGIFLQKLAKKDIYKNLGNILLGFAILMVGMTTMKNAMSPLQDSKAFTSTLTKFSNPILGILIGILFTAILQSASASVGILQSIAVTSFLPFSAALPIVMGIGIGAACPVLMSGMSSNKNGKRTALVYLLNDLFGMIIWGIIFYLGQFIITQGGQFSFMEKSMNSVSIALMNTVYRILTIIVLAPFIKQIDKLVHYLIKDSDDDKAEQADFDLLEERFLNYPDLALTQTHEVMSCMAKKAKLNVNDALKLLDNYSVEGFTKVQEKESIIDKYEDKLGTYLMKINTHNMSHKNTKESSKYLHTISDYERIGDHASGISKVAREIFEKKIDFSAEAKEELTILKNAIIEVLEITVNVFENNDIEKAKLVEPLRIHIKLLSDQLKKNHIKRLQNGSCGLDYGFAFNDLISNLDRIAAHCSNVAVAIIECEMDDFNTHKYLKAIKEDKNNKFVKDFQEYENKYSIPNR